MLTVSFYQCSLQSTVYTTIPIQSSYSKQILHPFCSHTSSTPKIIQYLNSSPSNLLNPTSHTQIQELIPNLNLQPSQNTRINFTLQHNLGTSRELTLHRILHRSSHCLIQRLRTNNSSLNLPPLGLHKLNECIRNPHNGTKTSITRQHRHQVQSDRGCLSLEHILDILGLVITRDQWVFEEGRKSLGCGGRVFNGKEFGFDLVECVGF
mmetsp:Transcript_15194/g.25660  ORF Transcript_15194/g.25660 Transcript_15194/m.25660 type:complete len:208 (+) Transcript_15194:95-718(+)